MHLHSEFSKVNKSSDAVIVKNMSPKEYVETLFNKNIYKNLKRTGVYMIDNGYLFAKDKKRLFINTSLGCNGNCKFCYLPKLGMKKMKTKTWEEILKLLNVSHYKFTKNTLITIGCFSECFDDINKKETIKIIKFFLSKGNQVQISTKKHISFDDIKELMPLIKYYGQFVIFVSSSTITNYKNYEFGTEELGLRFKTFDLMKYNIPVVLYIKPILQDVTIKDLALYREMIINKGISNVVIGSLFIEEEASEAVPFLNNGQLFYKECDDEKIIMDELNFITRVWRRSTEVMNHLKDFELFEEVKKEVSKLLEKDKSGHGIDHINRVYNMSLRFAHKERADEFVVSLIALLHEVDDYKLFGNESAKNLTNAKKIMNKFDIQDEVQEKVLEAIKKIGYKKSLMSIRPSSLEGMIVSDADMCDGLGVTGILRTYDYQKAHGKPFFDKNIFPDSNLSAKSYKLCDDSAVCHCFEKLLHLKNLMMTKSGREEASNRHEIVVSILYHLFEEENVPEWKEYLDNFLKSLSE